MSETITAAEYRASAVKTKRNKYGAKKVRDSGHVFDSQAEFRRFCQLKLMERAGLISGIVVHPKYDLIVNGRPILTRSDGYPNGRRVSVKFDFSYTKDGAGVVIEDVKSRATTTTAFLLRRAIFEALYYPVQVDIILA